MIKKEYIYAELSGKIIGCSMGGIEQLSVIMVYEEMKALSRKLRTNKMKTQTNIMNLTTLLTFLLTFNFLTLQTFNLGAQGVTKNGKITATGTDFVNINGRILSSQAISKNGNFLCPATMTISHLASGGVAPVNKTVTYGVVKTNLSGSNKCWITQNLGSANQASSATDATEASSGWYWQFNRKKGYKLADNDTRTPNTTWINSISEASDWTVANDPCTLELGTGWRIPTEPEWFAAYYYPQNWDNYTDTYNSVLKLHAAGLLLWSSGALSSRGGDGRYWTSSSVGYGDGNILSFGSYSLGMDYLSKPYGFSVRCLRD